MRSPYAFLAGSTIDIFDETDRGYLLSFDADSFLCVKLVEKGIELTSKDGVSILFECSKDEGESLVAQISTAACKYRSQCAPGSD